MMTQTKTKIMADDFDENSRYKYGAIAGFNNGIELGPHLGTVKFDAMNIIGSIVSLYGTSIVSEGNVSSGDEIDVTDSLTVGLGCKSKFGLKVGGEFKANEAQGSLINVTGGAVIKNHIQSEGNINLGSLISKNLYSGNCVTINSCAHIFNCALVDNRLRVGQDLLVQGNLKTTFLDVRRNLKIINHLDVLMDAEIAGDFDVEGKATINNKVIIGGDIISSYINCPDIKLKGVMKNRRI